MELIKLIQKAAQKKRVRFKNERRVTVALPLPKKTMKNLSD